MYFLLGVVLAPLVGLPMLVAGDGGGFSLVWVLVLPVLYGVLGYVSMAGFAWMYNLIAARIGGIEVEITTIARVSNGPGL
jgi:hypothetical protein